MNTRRGSFRSDDCNRWVDDLLQTWQNLGKRLEDLVVVCDNAPCHSRLNASFENNEAYLLRLGPYSPMLNPIENVWSSLKSHVKSNLRIPEIQGPNIGEQKLQYLEGTVNGGIDALNNALCARSCQHSTTFHGQVMALENVNVGV